MHRYLLKLYFYGNEYFSLYLKTSLQEKQKRELEELITEGGKTDSPSRYVNILYSCSTLLFDRL